MEQQSTVLIVDDTDNVRLVLEVALSPLCKTLSAKSGEEAIEILSNNASIAVVILDINMPVTDGWETLRIIKDPENGWPEIPVVMLSVHKEPENALKAWDLGAKYYIKKPFSVKLLCEVVKKLIDDKETSRGTF